MVGVSHFCYSHGVTSRIFSIQLHLFFIILYIKIEVNYIYIYIYKEENPNKVSIVLLHNLLYLLLKISFTLFIYKFF
jgi:hypothetical protein